MVASSSLMTLFGRVPLGQRSQPLGAAETQRMLQQTESEWHRLQQADQSRNDRDPRQESVDVYTPAQGDLPATRYQGRWQEQQMQSSRSLYTTRDPNGVPEFRSEQETWRDDSWVFRFESHRSSEGVTLRHYRLDRHHPENSTLEEFFLAPEELEGRPREQNL